MIIPRALLVPSSPTLLIDERRGNSTAMLTALAEIAASLEAERPETIVVVTSRWASGAAFEVDDAKKHRSVIDLPGFGVEPRYDCRGETMLARAILEEARRSGLRVAAARRGADSGVTVPLHFLAAMRHSTVVPVSVSDAPAAAHREWGACLRRAMTAWNGRAVLVVSGPLTFHQHSFNLKRDIIEDRDLDALALDAMQKGDWSAIAARSARFPAKAHPEVAWKHLDVLRGFLGDEVEVPGRVCAYEALPGIGEALVDFDFAQAHAVPAMPEAESLAAMEALAAGVTPATEPSPADVPANAAPPATRPARIPAPRITGTWRARPPELPGASVPRSAPPRSHGTSRPRPTGGARPSSSASSRPRPTGAARPGPSGSSRPGSSRPRPSGSFTPRPAGGPSSGAGRSSSPPRKPWSSDSRPPRPSAPRTPGAYSPRTPRDPAARPSRSPSRPASRSSSARPPRYTDDRPQRGSSVRPPSRTGTRPVKSSTERRPGRPSPPAPRKRPSS